MATVDELLAGIATVDKTLVISNDFRTIGIPSSVTNLGVEYDDDVLQLDFKMPRYVSNTDLSAFSIRINYINSKGESDVYTIRDAVIGEQYITFSWLVGPTATRYRGNTKFNVCAKIVKDDGAVDREFNTTIATLPVLEGLEVDESIVTEYSDIIEQWKRELFGIGDTEEASIKAVSQAEQDAIANEGARVLSTIPVDYKTAVRMTDNADRTKSDAIVCSAQGDAVTVSDSSDDYLRGLKVFGKTAQIITTGKNLLNIDENLSFTGLREKTVHIPAGTYVLTWSSRTSAGQNKPVIRFVDNSVLIDLLADSGNSKVTLTKDETTIYIYSNGYDYTASQTVSATITQLMLSVDGGEYEPYSGGFASPSPDWPQPLNNIESPTIGIYGKNVLGANSTRTATLSNGVTFKTVEGSSEYIFNGTATGQNGSGLLIQRTTIPPGTYTCSVRGLSSGSGSVDYINLKLYNTSKYLFTGLGNKTTRTFTIEEATEVLVEVVVCAGSVYNNDVVTVQLEANTVATDYEQCVGQQQISITSVDSLNGIPVSQNGNYTDENGQQWICDEIDFERGVYIQRIETKVFDGSADEDWGWGHDRAPFSIILPGMKAWGGNDKLALCDRYPTATYDESWIVYDFMVSVYSGTISRLCFRNINISTLDEWRSRISNNPITIQYALATPIEIPLSQTEIEWFRFAHTNFPNTTIINDAGAVMELKYNADTKLWLDNIPKVTDEQAGPLVNAWMNEHLDNVEGVVYGKSAYEIAVERGFVGSEAYWLTSLKGKDGRSPVKGVDYNTPEDKQEIVNAAMSTFNNYVIASGETTLDGVTWYYRKWADGFAECWTEANVRFDTSHGDSYYVKLVLPFLINDPNFYITYMSQYDYMCVMEIYELDVGVYDIAPTLPDYALEDPEILYEANIYITGYAE